MGLHRRGALPTPPAEPTAVDELREAAEKYKEQFEALMALQRVFEPMELGVTAAVTALRGRPVLLVARGDGVSATVVCVQALGSSFYRIEGPHSVGAFPILDRKAAAVAIARWVHSHPAPGRTPAA